MEFYLYNNLPDMLRETKKITEIQTNLIWTQTFFFHALGINFVKLTNHQSN